MNTLKLMAVATASLITLLASCNPAEKTAPKASNLIIEEEGNINGSYAIVRDKVSGVRVINWYNGGCAVLEKPQPLEGH